MYRPEELTIAHVEKTLKWKPRIWIGSCYGVASGIVDKKLVRGKAIYGHYRGPISKDSYWKDRRKLGFVHHGWIELPDGRILDPTRWVFENRKPYIYLGEIEDPFNCRVCGHPEDAHQMGFFRECELCGDCLDFERVRPEYDPGGNVLRAMMECPPPPFNKNSPPTPLPLQGKAKEHVFGLLGDPPYLTKDMVFWLANLALPRLGSYVRPIYEAIKWGGYESYIPMDNRKAILDDLPPPSPPDS